VGVAILEVFVVALITAFATGLGAIPVGWLGPERVARLQPMLLGITAGVMTAASIGLLIEPINEGKYVPMAVGLLIGMAFLLIAQRLVEKKEGDGEHPFAKHQRRSLLVFAVLFVHSLPEGFALGSAWASSTAAIGVFVFIAISLQNIPEGTATAIPMAQAGYSRTRQFWAAVGTSAPQPVGAVIAYVLVEQVRALLPWSLGFAAGAMFALVVSDLLPEAVSEPADRKPAAIGTIGAMVGMGVLGFALSSWA
jgi:ZIP family zinc transporter